MGAQLPYSAQAGSRSRRHTVPGSEAVPPDQQHPTKTGTLSCLLMKQKWVAPSLSILWMVKERGVDLPWELHLQWSSLQISIRGRC